MTTSGNLVLLNADVDRGLVRFLHPAVKADEGTVDIHIYDVYF